MPEFLTGIELKPTDVKGPLAAFQHTIFQNREDFRKLVAAINNEIENSPLLEAVVTKVFDKWWPDLESNVAKILAAQPMSQLEERSEPDILKEILELSRYIARHTRTKEEDQQVEADLHKMKKLLNLPVEELGLNAGTLQPILRMGIRNIGTLSTYSENLFEKGGFSRKSIDEIQRKLRGLGLSLGMMYQHDLFDDVLHPVKLPDTN